MQAADEELELRSQGAHILEAEQITVREINE